MMMDLPPGFSVSAMTSEEVATLGAWAAAEGWNPGRNDLAIARAVDPEAFIALRDGETLAGGGTIFSYDGRFGFMGLFIIRPEYRGRGLGGALWRWRLARQRERLATGATIGMDDLDGAPVFMSISAFQLNYDSECNPDIAFTDVKDYQKSAA